MFGEKKDKDVELIKSLVTDPVSGEKKYITAMNSVDNNLKLILGLLLSDEELAKVAFKENIKLNNEVAAHQLQEVSDRKEHHKKQADYYKDLYEKEKRKYNGFTNPYADETARGILEAAGILRGNYLDVRKLEDKMRHASKYEEMKRITRRRP